MVAKLPQRLELENGLKSGVGVARLELVAQQVLNKDLLLYGAHQKQGGYT
jgi:hypothetical protein